MLSLNINHLLAVGGGLVLLAWSAGRFVDGAAALARYFGMAPLIIGMVIVGFGTSAPEMMVSAIAALRGNPNLALGNAYGSNIANIALILGLTALISPITVRSGILRRELPVLSGVMALAAWQLHDNALTRAEAGAMLILFGVWMILNIWRGRRYATVRIAHEVTRKLEKHAMPLRSAVFWLAAGLSILILSSYLLVWGATGIARTLGMSDLVIGLTIVAFGTSLPELATTLVAVYKGEHDMAMGNVLGSNLFNTMAVVGIAGVIHPLEVGPEVFLRDLPVMAGLTLSLFVIGSSFKGPGRINRVEGLLLLTCYVGYIRHLLMG